MAEIAYDLDRFASSGRKHQVRVVKGAKKAGGKEAGRFRMLGNLVMALLVVTLTCGVLYTQTSVNELQSQIAKEKTALSEQESLNAYLTLEMDNISNIKEIEERALQLGMVKMNSNQITYIQVEEGESIEREESGFSKLANRAGNGLLSAVDYLMP